MKLLALETSTEACSAALFINGTISARFRHAPRLQTELLLPMLDELLAEHNIQLGDIDVLAYSRGPGAFTGVRIAAAAVQGIAFARDIPVVAVSSLQTLAQGVWRVHGAEQVLAVFDARMDEVYIGAYAQQNGLMQNIAADTVVNPQHIADEFRAACADKKLFAAGNGMVVHRETLCAQFSVSGVDDTFFPSAEDVIPLALAQYAQTGAQTAAQALPVYLRDDVWKKLPGRA